MVFTLRGFRIALFAGDGFSKLLAAGLTFGFALQTFIIVGGILRVIPLTGITLPLVSYGGSSILANFLVLAGLMLVSNRANAEPRARVNRQLNRLAVAAIVLLVALIVATTYWQTWASAGLQDRQDNAIQRVVQFTIARGLIQSANGRATSRRTGSRSRHGQTLYFRKYPQRGLAAQTVGYSTTSRSQAGLERSMNDYLTGANTNLNDGFRHILDRLGSATVQGNNLQLTIRPGAQRLAKSCSATAAARSLR